MGQGRRSDLLEIVQLVQSGETSMERIARECPVQVIKYYKELRLIFASHDPSQNETLKRKLDSTMDVPDRARVEERSQRLKLLEDEYTTSLAEIGGMDTNSMSASSSMTFMDG